MSSFENWQVVLGIVQACILLGTFLGAMWIGFKQNEINDRLRILQDYVAISAVPNGDTIKLINTGKVNLYMSGFDMPGNNQRFKQARMIPAGIGDAANYWIPPPNPNSITGGEFEFKLYLTDEFGEKWISEAGGEIIRLPPAPIAAAPSRNSKHAGNQKSPTAQAATAIIKIWSYRTYKSDWT